MRAEYPYRPIVPEFTSLSDLNDYVREIYLDNDFTIFLQDVSAELLEELYSKVEAFVGRLAELPEFAASKLNFWDGSSGLDDRSLALALTNILDGLGLVLGLVELRRPDLSVECDTFVKKSCELREYYGMPIPNPGRAS